MFSGFLRIGDFGMMDIPKEKMHGIMTQPQLVRNGQILLYMFLLNINLRIKCEHTLLFELM